MIIQAFCQALQLSERVSEIQSITGNITNDALEHTTYTHANSAYKDHRAPAGL